MNLLHACDDQTLFGQWFRDRATWQAWFAFIAAMFGLPMTPEQAAIYRMHTGRDELPTQAITEGWLACGRRAGKSFVLALIAVFLACFKSYADHLGPGERGTVLVIATDRRQARVIFRYVRGLITGTPMLAAMIQGQMRADGLDLTNGVTIEVGTASFKTSRGYAFVAVLADEIAFWPSEDSAEPDFEILDALRPGMASIPGSVLLCASSPYAKRGALWEAYKAYYGKSDPAVLFWRADTRSMNPTIPQAVIDRAMERDSASASAEYLAEFRNDVQAFLTREVVEACVTPGCFERPRIPGVKYNAFTDPSGGSSDSMTLAISHGEGGKAILDVIREVKAPFQPETAVIEFAQTLKSYGLTSVRGDRYAGNWPLDAFSRHGITYQPAKLVKNDLYVSFLPLLNSQKTELLDNSRLVSQLVSLERRTSRGGRDSIDHPPNHHDDIANCVAGALVMTETRYRVNEASMGTYSRSTQRAPSRLQQEAATWSAPCTIM